MKTLLIILLIFGVATHSQCAETPATVDSVAIKLNKLIRISADANTAMAKLSATIAPVKAIHPDRYQWPFILLPVILFVAFLFYFLRWLKRDGYKIADALSVDMTDAQVAELQRAQVQTAEDPKAPAPEPVLKRSSSRFIAFLSGLSAVIMGLCIISYYMYFAILGLPIPKFEELWPILAALGIGVVPYASKVMNEKK